MEIKAIKCSSKDDKDIEANTYCGECNIYMCKKCEQFHSKLFSMHQIYNVENKNGNIFTRFCKEPEHRDKLEFFCKTHNILCCAACLCKIEKKGNGLHKDCDVCLIDEIKNDKEEKNKFMMKYLEDLLNKLLDSIDNLKILFEKIDKDKEELKLNIQNIFTKIRNELNNREDELLAEVDKLYNEICCDVNILKQSEKLPNIVKINLERSKSNVFDDNYLALNIYECMNIEKNIKEINEKNRNIKAFKNNNDIEIQFDYQKQLKLIIENFKKFGKFIIIDKNKTFDTKIVNEDKSKQESIINWIKKSTNKNKIKLEKIFSMKINGDLSKDFHNYCDNRGPTLTIIKTTNNKIFGGFTPLNFESYGGIKYDKDDQTFIFSLNLMKKYKMINKEKDAIYCEEKYGPYFGGKDFYIESNMKKGMTYSNKLTNFIEKNNLELTGGRGEKESFNVEDFEVFEVIY